MSSESFYANLPILEDFIQITHSQNFVPVPPDWYVIVTDIDGSTQAIEEGRYKEVNLIGASSIVAVLNVAGSIEIPFVFGGDGASIVIPPSLLSATKECLLATKNLARTEFGFDLRVGIMPVSVIPSNHQLNVAKFKVSENYTQSIFVGGGLTYATNVVKNPATAHLYELGILNFSAKANFSGLKCRWQDVLSQFGETASLLIMATSQDRDQANQVYQSVIQEIETIYGSDQNFRPIAAQNLNLTFDDQKLRLETKVQTAMKHLLSRRFYHLNLKLENLWMWLMSQIHIGSRVLGWRNFKDIIIESCDYKKFDDLLRMVISSNTHQRQQLEHYLETEYQMGRLIYGVHISNRALMTCLVFERNGRQVHFVDGADGGYAMAAKAMKLRLLAASHSPSPNYSTT
ncbi:DUF3095 domain-containing protein [Leptolyngbya sp. FACHB-16]|uniref:DUF3095 domain-containing protein n=1 Tax=unclassified Leptolyngbya TaxID=2650499 RepID=UPI001685C9B5|nr:DUF3095 domain-containing protein [Leptolyngbya sp. FACHB-16]MBD2155628.1 DUF3095 domain-containing protein [Leptolyngbya sp. FACHB-16]